MYIIYCENDYQVNKVHSIDKNVTYSILDEDTKEISTLKGANLLKRLNNDVKLNSFTFKNVNYKCKPMIYWDENLEMPEQINKIVCNMETCSVQSNVKSLNFSMIPIKNGSGCFIINNLVLDLTKFDLPYYDSNIRFKPYKLCMTNSIEVFVNDDCKLTSIVFDNIQFSKTVIKCNIIFSIIDTVRNSYENSVKLEAIIDFEKRQLITRGSKVDLPTTAKYSKATVLGKNNKANEFEFDKFSELSNYFDCKVFYDGRTYLSSEAAYQSVKTLDSKLRDKFTTLTPDEAKELGIKIEGSDSFRKDWDSVKVQLMYEIVLAKFSQNESLRDALFRTKGYNLVENTTGWHDRIWGRCHCDVCKGSGENYLGKILTAVRKELGCNE